MTAYFRASFQLCPSLSMGSRSSPRMNLLLPLPAPRCPELAELIAQIENLPAPDGFRRIANLLVDAQARNFYCVDPAQDHIIDTPPAIGFDVDTGKFSGRVGVLYDRTLDLYVVELRHGGDLVAREEQVDFSALGGTLERLIDDGAWRRIRIILLDHAGKARH